MGTLGCYLTPLYLDALTPVLWLGIGLGGAAVPACPELSHQLPLSRLSLALAPCSVQSTQAKSREWYNPGGPSVGPAPNTAMEPKAR